jgi:hypothetical protein
LRDLSGGATFRTHLVIVRRPADTVDVTRVWRLLAFGVLLLVLTVAAIGAAVWRHRDVSPCDERIRYPQCGRVGSTLQ